jgi:Flp pilus assembly protein TadD
MRLSKWIALCALWLSLSSGVRAASTQDSLRVSALLKSAQSELQKGRQARAVELAQEAHRLSPNRFDTNFLLGVSFQNPSNTARQNLFFCVRLNLNQPT